MQKPGSLTEPGFVYCDNEEFSSGSQSCTFRSAALPLRMKMSVHGCSCNHKTKVKAPCRKSKQTSLHHFWLKYRFAEI